MSDDLAKQLEVIKNTVSTNKVVLYMKGTKDFPQCGFSALVVKILQTLNVEFVDINVLADGNIREAIKQYSDWPTIPQLYVNSEFIGGCDITRDLYQSGELQKILAV